jgi:hypothetical protein
MPRKHTIPKFLEDIVHPDTYERWLARKAAAHCKRDRSRGCAGVTQSLYKEAIHAAVLFSEGRDAYTAYSGEDERDSGRKPNGIPVGR